VLVVESGVSSAGSLVGIRVSRSIFCGYHAKKMYGGQ